MRLGATASLDQEEDMEIIYKSKNAIVINKPFGMPSQPDKSGDVDAMTATQAALREMGERGELYIINRLDRVVGGLLVFARNSAAAARLSSAVAEREMVKEYFAVLEGECQESGTLTDYIYKDARLSKAFVASKSRNGVKYAELNFDLLEKINVNGKTLSLVKVKLSTGRFHQIRVQFASRKLPLVGDKKYGSRDAKAKMPALFACGLAFSFLGKDEIFFVTPETDKYPWNLFNKEKFEQSGEL